MRNRFGEIKPYLIFFFLLLIPFTAYFLRPDFIANDGYGFLLLGCQKNNIAGITGLPFLVFSWLPCNFLAYKLLLFELCFFSGCFLIKMAILFSPRNGWRASYLVFLAPVFVLQFARLENDAFGFLFCFAALYFFFKSLLVLEKSRRNFFVSLALVFCGSLFWTGSLFLLVGFSLNVWVLLLLTIPVVLVFLRKSIGIIFSDWRVDENEPLAFSYVWLLGFGILSILHDRLLAPQAMFFFALGMASAKFWMLSVPFLAVGLVLVLERFNPPKWFKIDLNEFLAIISIVMVAVVCQSIWLAPPQSRHWQAIDYALGVGNGEINNDWGMGYWVLWRGGRTDSFQSPQLAKEIKTGQVFVTQKESLPCPVLREFGQVKVLQC